MSWFIRANIRFFVAVRKKEQKYIEYQTKLQEIGRMLGGWMSRLQKGERVKNPALLFDDKKTSGRTDTQPGVVIIRVPSVHVGAGRINITDVYQFTIRRTTFARLHQDQRGRIRHGLSVAPAV